MKYIHKSKYYCKYILIIVFGLHFSSVVFSAEIQLLANKSEFSSGEDIHLSINIIDDGKVVTSPNGITGVLFKVTNGTERHVDHDYPYEWVINSEGLTLGNHRYFASTRYKDELLNSDNITLRIVNSKEIDRIQFYGSIGSAFVDDGSSVRNTYLSSLKLYFKDGSVGFAGPSLATLELISLTKSKTASSIAELIVDRLGNVIFKGRSEGKIKVVAHFEGLTTHMIFFVVESGYD